jgi:hypothetical protein
MRKQTLVKLVLVLIALIVVPWLFLRTLQNTIAEPYEVALEALSGWTLVLADPARPAVWAVGLQPPSLFRSGLFDQLFDRTMASMTSPVDDVLPIALGSELRGGPGAISPDAIRRAADEAGLERARLQPVCMAVKRETFAGRTREFHFVVFDIPEVAAFRLRLDELVADGAGGAVLGPLDLILPIAGSDAAFGGWWPVVVDRETDCQAPVGSEP